jgi:hypothetical protein
LPLCEQQPCLILTLTFNVLNTHPDGDNAHNMAGVRQQSVHCGVLQLHEVHILHAAATRVLQWIHVQKNLSSIAAVDVVAALKHRTQIASRCAEHNACGGKIVFSCQY